MTKPAASSHNSNGKTTLKDLADRHAELVENMAQLAKGMADMEGRVAADVAECRRLLGSACTQSNGNGNGKHGKP